MSDTKPTPWIDPEVLAAQALLREKGVAPGNAQAQPFPEARAATRAYQAALNEGGPTLPAVTEHLVTGDFPAVKVRLYRPEGTAPRPAFLHVHGGGFAFGDIESLDRWKRELAAETGAVVVGLEYALSPDHRYPVALAQVLAVLRWLRAEAAALGLDPDRIGIGGDSAGGNLALAALLALRDAGEAGPRFGAIIYGMLSAEHDSDSHRDWGDGTYGLSTEKLAWYWDMHLGGAMESHAYPLHAEMAGLPPLLLLAAGLDPLLDDTLNLDRKLTAAGVEHSMMLYRGVPHGFIAQTALLAQAREARQAVAAGIARYL